jgi:mono/diheme cytochrome c family protein
MKLRVGLGIALAGIGYMGCSSAGGTTGWNEPSRGGAGQPGDPMGSGPEIDPTQMTSSAAANACLAAASGDTKLCANCECGSCRDKADACYLGPDPKKNAQCAAVVACERANQCTGDACYCGSSPLCGLVAGGPCVKPIDAAMGGTGQATLDVVRLLADPSSPLVRAEALVGCGQSWCGVQCAPAGATCVLADDPSCQDRICAPNPALEAQRATSALQAPAPTIASMSVNGTVVWTPSTTSAPTLRPGDTVTLDGSGFGQGVDVDFSKILIGNSRVLETHLTMYTQQLDIAKQVNYETATPHDHWAKDIVSWADTRIVFHVPVHASQGPLVVQVQKRLPGNDSLLRPGEKHLVVNAQTLRITDASFKQTCDVVSGLGPAAASAPIPVTIDNAGFSKLAAQGRAIFWSYDYNIGLAHKLRGMDWPAILAGQATDPVAGGAADPWKLFGAVATVRGQVPDEAIDAYAFDPYPQPNPIPGFLTLQPQLTSGQTTGTGFAGYRYAQSSSPFGGPGSWVGFNCASCHGAPVTYEPAPATTVTRVVPGLPNPMWTMKWAVLSNMSTIKSSEEGPAWDPDKVAVDKTALLYAMPQGTGEHTMVRNHGEGSSTDNDYNFSPIAIPNVTHYTAIRRSLSHTESYVGFEGSYIHSEEPDGAMGSMGTASLQALTAYMTTLDQYDDELRRVGMYRWLKEKGLLSSEVATGVGEGQFVQSGWSAYPTLASHIVNGKAIFATRCGSCHADGVGANTTEVMVRLDQVGRFFAPTVYQKQMQSIRATFLRDLYWTQHRGLLSDGHVRNLHDLVDPARCTQGSALYNAYYTLHAPQDPGSPGTDFPAPYPTTYRRGDVFRVPVAPSLFAGDAGDQRNRFIERHRYFTKVPWDAQNYYWDYQKMRASWGPAELGTVDPVGLPATPHPWCAGAASEVDDLIHYLLTL